MMDNEDEQEEEEIYTIGSLKNLIRHLPDSCKIKLTINDGRLHMSGLMNYIVTPTDSQDTLKLFATAEYFGG